MSPVTRLFWEALDRVDYAVTLARCWAVDLIYGPEPPTPADRQREAEHERLQKAFPVVDFDETARRGASHAAAGDADRFPHCVRCSPAPTRGIGSSARTLNTPP
jgi:hypothetical protein